MTRTSKFRWLGVPLVALAMIAVPLSAWAALEAPFEGNQTCSAFNDSWIELFKAEVDGDLNGSSAGVSWSITEGAHGEIVSWTSSQPLVAVAVKGGKIGGNLYEYSPSATSDAGLHTPVNNANGKWADVSHISFCVHPDEPEPGMLVIEKVTDPPNGYPVFQFATSGEGMTEPWMAQLTNGGSASHEVMEGWYTIAESPADGWTFEAVSCDSEYDPMGSGVAVFVGEGQTVTCTFLNELDYEPVPGTVTIKKITAPATEAVPFTFATDIPVDDGVFGPTLFHGGAASVEAWPGVYMIDEIVPDGWLLTGVACTDDDVTYTETGAQIEVDYDEDVECIFTNEPIEEEEGRVVIRKLTEPATPDVPFSFTSDIPRGDGLFEPVLYHGQTDGTQVEPGMYTIDELIPDGWDLTGVECDDDEYVVTDTGAQIYVEAGERVRCTFTNEPEPEPDPGTVVIHKVTDPSGSEEVFEFDSSIPDGEALWTPSLMDGDYESIEVDAGTYTVNEIASEGWTLTGHHVRQRGCRRRGQRCHTHGGGRRDGELHVHQRADPRARPGHRRDHQGHRSGRPRGLVPVRVVDRRLRSGSPA